MISKLIIYLIMLAQFTELKYDHFFSRRQLLLIKWNFGQIQTSQSFLLWICYNVDPGVRRGPGLGRRKN